MYQIGFTPRASKNFEKIPEKWQKKLWEAVEELKAQPFRGKKLQGRLIGLYSLRVWPYRVIYLIKRDEIKIIVVDIGHIGKSAK